MKTWKKVTLSILGIGAAAAAGYYFWKNHKLPEEIVEEVVEATKEVAEEAIK